MQLTGFHSVFDCHRPPISRINIVLKKLETFIAMLELAFDTNWKETRSFMDVFGNDLNETFLESLRSYCNTEPTDYHEGEFNESIMYGALYYSHIELAQAINLAVGDTVEHARSKGRENVNIIIKKAVSINNGFECIFDDDWSMTVNTYSCEYSISPFGTFLNPKVEDESNNWGNRGGFLQSYREAKALVTI